MSFAPGTRVGPYEIRALLGVGGMGEVYRAVDTKLGRDVAIKFLPESVATDAARHARFEREAQTLAALNHPHIAQIYGLEDNALVMELLDGVTLAERLADGPLPIRKAIDYSVQIARGLAAAHDRGIVHRDLKPENVFVLKDGHVKIIDFGLARGHESQTSDDTLTKASARVNTDPGTVMGTIGYMAPEQVRGERLDARADLFSLGAVLHEMLTGQRAFKRGTAAETMTAILRDDPVEISAARADVPPALERIVRHCLEKNPVERFQTARDVAFALDSLSAHSSGSIVGATATAPPSAAGPWRERLLWIGISTALAGLAIWLVLIRANRSDAVPRPPADVAYRSILPLPDGAALAQEIQAPLRLALSPDGQRIAFVRSANIGTDVATSAGRNTIWEYSLATGTSRMIPGTEGGNGPAWSKTGGRLVFNVGNQLKMVDEQARVTVVPGLMYGEFGDPGQFLGLIGTPGRWTVVVVRQAGGPVEKIYEPPAPGEELLFLKLLPGNRLYVAQRRLTSGGGWQVEIGSVDGGPSAPLVPNASTPQVAAGQLLFTRLDRLYAQPLDVARRQVTGEPTLLAEHLDYSTATGAAYAVSDRVLVYAGAVNNLKGRLTLMNRDGTTVSTVSDAGEYSNVELSPDGRRLAVSLTDTERNTHDIYLVDLARGVRQRLTSDPTDERAGVWTRDGRSVIYNSKGLDMYRRPSDFGGTEARVLLDGASKDPRDVSPDGTQLLYRLSGIGTSNDIWALSLTGDPQPHAVLATPANENYASFSPDGRSIVYVSDESGRAEVYVMSLAGGGRFQVSTGGGTFPRWRRPQEIVYLAPDRTLMRVPVDGGTFGAPAPLFKITYLEGPGTPFDITADGQRFIVNATTQSTLPPSLFLVVNWTALLRH